MASPAASSPLPPAPPAGSAGWWSCPRRRPPPARCPHLLLDNAGDPAITDRIRQAAAAELVYMAPLEDCLCCHHTLSLLLFHYFTCSACCANCACSNPWARSATRSSPCSIPTDRRSNWALIPPPAGPQGSWPVGHAGRMGHQTLHPAEGLRHREAQPREEGAQPRLVAIELKTAWRQSRTVDGAQCRGPDGSAGWGDRSA